MPKSVDTNEYDQLCFLLIQARKDVGLTQIELAKTINRPQSFVSKYERGERRLDVIEFMEVLQAFRLDASEFLQKLTVAIETDQRSGKG